MLCYWMQRRALQSRDVDECAPFDSGGAQVNSWLCQRIHAAVATGHYFVAEEPFEGSDFLILSAFFRESGGLNKSVSKNVDLCENAGFGPEHFPTAVLRAAFFCFFLKVFGVFGVFGGFSSPYLKIVWLDFDETWSRHQRKGPLGFDFYGTPWKSALFFR